MCKWVPKISITQMCRDHSHASHVRWFLGHISCNHSHLSIELYGLWCWRLLDLYAGRLQFKGVPKISITLVCRFHSHEPNFWWFWGYISCVHSHMWIEPCALLCWWHAGLYAGRLQCKWVAKISITLVCRVHSHKPHLRWFLEHIPCIHSHMWIEPCGLLSWYLGGMSAYMWADFSAKGCPQYPFLWCAGSIATHPILGDF